MEEALRRRAVLAGDTAEVFAALRACGAAERDPAIRHPDYLAARLLPWAPRLTTLAKLPVGRTVMVRASELISPGAYCYELARGRHMDDVLLGSLGRGLEQLVILGAGMDTRAYRYAQRLSDVAVFEIDHPVTAAHKERAIRRHFGDVPAHVRYLRVDLEVDDLAASLLAGGFTPTSRTLFIWSGVSGYLASERVARVLLFVAGSPGNEIVFDYWYAAVIDGDYSYFGAERAATRVARMGEPYKSGIDPDQPEAYLAEHGLELVSNLGPDELEDRYLRRTSGRTRGRPYGFLGIAHASARPPTGAL